MKKYKPQFVFVLIVLVSFVLSSCNLSMEITPTPNIEATAAAAISATQTADANIEAAIEAGVAATQTALPTSEIAADDDISVTEGEYTQYTEEELALLIDEAVQDAVTASEQATTTTTQATYDNSLSQDEIDELYYYSSEAEELIYFAEELLEIYTYLYGDYAEYADDMISLLYLLEEDMDEILVFMGEALEIVESNDEISPETVTQLYEAAQSVGLSLETLSTNQDLIITTVEMVLAERENFAFSFNPDQMAESRADALIMAKDYALTMRDAFTDQKISAEELAELAQLGANAAAALESQGGPALKNLPDMINTLTAQAALGQFSAALSGLQKLEAAIPGR